MGKKTIYSILTACLLAATIAGCKKSSGKEAEKNIIELTKQMELPVNINNATKLTECLYSDKILTYSNETSVEIPNINVDSLKQRTLDNLKTKSQKLVSNIIKANASIRYIYINNSDTIMFTFSADDLKK